MECSFKSKRQLLVPSLCYAVIGTNVVKNLTMSRILTLTSCILSLPTIAPKWMVLLSLTLILSKDCMTFYFKFIHDKTKHLNPNVGKLQWTWLPCWWCCLHQINFQKSLLRFSMKFQITFIPWFSSFMDNWKKNDYWKYMSCSLRLFEFLTRKQNIIYY